jgi:hypothetical protein
MSERRFMMLTMGDSTKAPSSFELHFDEARSVVCDLGVIAHPWLTRVLGTHDVVDIDPVIMVDGVTVFGLEEWEWLNGGDFDLRLTKSDDGSRMFLEIHAGKGRWTYELFEAHWRDESPYAPIDAGVYLGIWPD